jgi:hypothetical protein
MPSVSALERPTGWGGVILGAWGCGALPWGLWPLRFSVLQSDSRNHRSVESAHARDLQGSWATTKHFTQGRGVEFEGWTFVGRPHGAPSQL